MRLILHDIHVTLILENNVNERSINTVLRKRFLNRMRLSGTGTLNRVTNILVRELHDIATQQSPDLEVYKERVKRNVCVN